MMRLRERKIVEYLRTMHSLDEMDLIIALGMAKEGFDWPYCEHALTVGYQRIADRNHPNHRTMYTGQQQQDSRSIH